ncbi:hypothetical protein [Pedobacter cryophilus]|uniref:Uncharacterized protein n=1 Tax=Pedobacter cryophilus TaxID=2571271 RepID=A0A4U1BYP7_9SPHI|nr:hypothetical protein [Pedobacter cryophilus]TKB95541.1 hypothetical protein FA046_16200 [Pedobacter cryophilus]
MFLRFTLIAMLINLLGYNNLYGQEKRDISKFIMQNFKVPAEKLNNCKWNYLVLETTLDKTNKLNYKVLSSTDTFLIKNISFLNSFKVNEINVKSFPALIIISIQDNVGLCDNEYAKIPAPSDVLQQILPLISQSVKDYPKIRILEPIIANIEASRQ